MIIVHSTKLLNPFGEAVTSPLFFVLLKDPFEILITALRHCRYAPMAEGSDCTSILNLYTFFSSIRPFFLPHPPPSKKICPAMLPLPANILSTSSAGSRTDAPYALFTPVSNPYLTRCKPVSYKNQLHSTYTTVTHYEHEMMPMKWNFC